MFEWDRNNLRKIRAHGIEQVEAEQSLSNDPILVYEQNIADEMRFLYYSETDAGRLLAIVATERGDKLRLVTAYDLDASQRRDYFARRIRGE